ncbi:MAG: rhodanese-like domain-containing protein [Synergistaceae bacterium]|nr:rhodanese-like domain-containing protein [Synergistaceae bacterium]
MDQAIREEFKVFTAGLADNKGYMMEMAEAKPKIEAGENNLFVIDIRSEASYKAGHIPGSASFYLPTLVDRLEHIPQNRPIFVVCKLDAMSAYATMILRLVGYPATLVAGGVPAWADAGGALDSD